MNDPYYISVWVALFMDNMLEWWYVSLWAI